MDTLVDCDQNFELNTLWNFQPLVKKAVVAPIVTFVWVVENELVNIFILNVIKTPSLKHVALLLKSKQALRGLAPSITISNVAFLYWPCLWRQKYVSPLAEKYICNISNMEHDFLSS